MMTRQEVFDKVVAHLRAQGRKAVNERGDCVYHAPDGTKCAAGCLILDEHYREDFEDKSSAHPDVARALRNSGVPEDASTLVRDLQRIHDSFDLEEWEDRLAGTASLFDLTYSAPVAS